RPARLGRAAGLLNVGRKHGQPAHALELLPIPRRDGEAVGERRRRDPEVVCADRLAAPVEVGPDLSVDSSDRFGDRERLEAGKHVLDERPASHAPRTRSAMHAMEQLADGDDADRPLFVADERLEPRSRLRMLPLDQEIGVDQDGQAPSGRPTVLRIVRTSAAKSSSTRGADEISSRNRSAESVRTFGGAMTATGTPARVTSISSPPATRFNTSENRRATAGAVRR